MSLNTKLLYRIREYYPDKCPLDALLDLCHHEGYKESNGERQLRRLVHLSRIKVVKSSKGYITGYLYELDSPTYKFGNSSVKIEMKGGQVGDDAKQDQLFNTSRFYR